jgi:hypothetical protein
MPSRLFATLEDENMVLKLSFCHCGSVIVGLDLMNKRIGKPVSMGESGSACDPCLFTTKPEGRITMLIKSYSSY